MAANILEAVLLAGVEVWYKCLHSRATLAFLRGERLANLCLKFTPNVRCKCKALYQAEGGNARQEQV